MSIFDDVDVDRPLIVAIEGTDAAGKHTQSELLAKKIGAKVFSFPNYETVSGQLIKAHLTHQWWCTSLNQTKAAAHGFVDKAVDPYVFQALQTVNRLELKAEIENAFAEGTNIVYDRLWLSAMVYGGLDGVQADWIMRINEKVLPQPHIWFLLHISPEMSFVRRPERRDRYETNREFLTKVSASYYDHFKMMKDTHNAVIIDGANTVEEVHDEIMLHVNQLRS